VLGSLKSIVKQNLGGVDKGRLNAAEMAELIEKRFGGGFGANGDTVTGN